MKKKLISILLAACLLLALAACGSNNAGGTQDKTYVVGVCSWSSTTRWTPPPAALKRP